MTYNNYRSNYRVVSVPVTTAAQAHKKFRQLINAGQIAIPPYAKRRMAQRNINDRQVRRVLTGGVITEGPYIDTDLDWKCKMAASPAGQYVQVVAALHLNGDEVCVVVTVF